MAAPASPSPPAYFGAVEENVADSWKKDPVAATIYRGEEELHLHSGLISNGRNTRQAGRRPGECNGGAGCFGINNTS